MLLDYQGKVVVVTGASNAAGQAVCKRFAAYGAKVAAVDTDGIDELVCELNKSGAGAIAVKANVGCKAEADAMIEKVVEAFGRVDVLVNNACVECPVEERKPLQDFDDGLWQKIIDTGINSIFFCSKAASRRMIEQGQGGAIVNVASAAGLTPIKNQCAFVAANAGVYNFTKAMSLELGPHRIRVNAVAPGAIEGAAYIDGMVSHDAEKRPGKPEELAETVCFVADSTVSGFTTGAVIAVDGGFSAGFARDF